MIRNAKTLGVALAALFAMSAMMASAASAADFSSSFTGGKTFVTADDTGELEHKFTVNNRTVTCHDTSFVGETVTPLGGGTWNGVTITPTYHNCTAFGLPATVDLNGCDYKFTPNGDVKVCPGGGSITVTVFNTSNHAVAPVCTFHIPKQTIVAGITYTNKAGPPKKDVTVDVNATNITTDVTGPILTCGTNGHRPATYTGGATVTGWEDAAHTKQVDVQHVP